MSQRTFITVLSFSLLLIIVPSHYQIRAQSSPSTQMISQSNQGEPGDDWSSSPSISTDGRFIAYISSADNLVPEDTNKATDVFVYDSLTSNTQRVSVSSYGEQANAGSSRATISGNGRFVVFESMADNLVPDDSNHALDVFVHDRLTQQTNRVSVSVEGAGGNKASSIGSISSDGRYVAFASLATNLIPEDVNLYPQVFIRDRWAKHTFVVTPLNRVDLVNSVQGSNLHLSPDGRTVAFTSHGSSQVKDKSGSWGRIFIYNRTLEKMDTLELSHLEPSSRLIYLALSADSKFLTYLALHEIGNVGQATIYLQDLEKDSPQVVTTFPITSQLFAYPPNLGISDTGRFLIALIPNLSGSEADVMRYNLRDGSSMVLGQASLSGGIALAGDGNVFAYTKEINGINQIYIQNLEGQSPPRYSLSGRVTDPSGQPLGLVTISVARDGWYPQAEPFITAKTDQQGYYFLNGIPNWSLRVNPTKLGYRFTPNARHLQIGGDIQNLDFTPLPEGIIDEAKADIGMPYSFERGCDNPWRGCGGPYHGFKAGYCTDLILDAYTWGANFSIQFALEQDFRAQPWHLYRWRDSRNAHDMWRYFSHSEQMLTHNDRYQQGDLVFFDWSEDGEIDHVALVSDVNERYRPQILVDASGIIDINPSGLAAELPWAAFHERTVRGHARWSGIYEPVITAPPQGEMLQMALSGGDLNLNLSDGKGDSISANEITIQGGIFMDLLWEQAISLREPLSKGYQYTVKIANFGDQIKPFYFTIQTLQNNLIADRLEFKGVLAPGRIKRYSLRLGVTQRGELSVDFDLHRRKVSGKIWK